MTSLNATETKVDCCCFQTTQHAEVIAKFKYYFKNFDIVYDFALHVYSEYDDILAGSASDSTRCATASCCRHRLALHKTIG